MEEPAWRYLGPRWWPWRQAVLLAPHGRIPAGYRWRVSLWPWPTPEETEAALWHDYEYERAAEWRREVDAAFVRSLPPGALRWACRTPVGALVFRVGWWA